MASLGLQMIVFRAGVDELRIHIDVPRSPRNGRMSGDRHLALAAFNVTVFNDYMRTAVLRIWTILQFKRRWAVPNDAVDYCGLAAARGEAIRRAPPICVVKEPDAPPAINDCVVDQQRITLVLHGDAATGTVVDDIVSHDGSGLVSQNDAMVGRTFDDVFGDDCRTQRWVDSVILTGRVIKQVAPHETRGKAGGAFTIEVNIVVIAGLAHKVAVLYQNVGKSSVYALSD